MKIINNPYRKLHYTISVSVLNTELRKRIQYARKHLNANITTKKGVGKTYLTFSGYNEIQLVDGMLYVFSGMNVSIE